MVIDLRECKRGDKLRSVHGEILTYIGPLPEDDYYDHRVQYSNGSYGSRIHDGHVYRNPKSRMECDHDIVEIIKE